MRVETKGTQKIITLHRAQAKLHTVKANECYALWGRGTGKTSGVLGPHSLECIETMPRSIGCLLGYSYEQIYQRTLPELLLSWEEHGFVKGKNYVVNERPPKNWPQPFVPLPKYDNVISFSNGTAMRMVSMQVAGCANGLNVQWLIGDELKYIDPDKLTKEIIPALRGLKEYFGHLSIYRSKYFCTDKLGADIEWILKKRKLVDHDRIEVIISIALAYNKLVHESQLFKLSSDDEKRRIRYARILNELRQDLVYVSEASSFENFENLGEGYFIDMKKSLSPYEFDIAIKNEDPITVEAPFYNKFSNLNLYYAEGDVDYNKPFIVAMDYQHSIQPLVAAQIGLHEAEQVLKFVRGLHSFSGLTDAVDMFCAQYQFHPLKTVYYVHDHTAIGRNPVGDTFRDIVFKRFQQNGWGCILVYTGDAPDHDIKHEKMNMFLESPADFVLPIRINGVTCEDMVTSICFSSAKMMNGKTKKDKDDEKDLRKDQNKTTHYSDTFDQLVWAVNELKLIPWLSTGGNALPY